nr:hypothetical protein [Parabacteroides goldsteinii]
MKARNLPIEVCYVSDDWKDERGAVAEVIVVRRRAGGNVCRRVRDQTG